MKNITLSRFFICILILTLLFLNGLLLFNLKKCKKSFSDERKQNNIKLENLFIQSSILEDYYIEQLKYDYIKLENFLLSKNEEVIDLKELLNNEMDLVFFAPENACSPCYDGILDQFSFISESIGEDRFIVIVPENDTISQSV
ncbi:MAG: hypothetical protein AB7S50_06150 [Bacteroidales bacterium]